MKIDIFNTDKKYDIIYADPPWAYLWGKGETGGNFCPEKHYHTMSTEQICELGKYIKKIRQKNCALFIWCTMPCLPDDKNNINELSNWLGGSLSMVLTTAR